MHIFLFLFNFVGKDQKHLF